ncbi:SUKH-4 family immunity protein [Streptomyces meridianus]|uniref:SUKH-4 family immunity protein n=1 Tax=Streptomyces meridianus TaxID=2938945 RepID=A0ABT0XBF1_9ACTN|nr:SUKH-4 family immunity protein [Streptomyces meridianus]MCM2579856.1 SUKH-4 family immunity protein [Streptomyces meridianus]
MDRVNGPSTTPPGPGYEQACTWLEEHPGGLLWVGGLPSAGKSRLLERVAREQNAVVVDCGAKSAEQVAEDLAIAWGTDSPLMLDEGLRSAAQRLEESHVVLLLNTQWAGQLRTSVEPDRVVRQIAKSVRQSTRPEVELTLLVEVADAVKAVERHGGHALRLTGGVPASTAPERAGLAGGPSAPEGVSPVLVPALAETARIPLDLWGSLCTVLGTTRSESQLRTLAENEELLDLTEGTDGEFCFVSFRREADALAWRNALSPERAAELHTRIVGFLTAEDAFGDYSARALPGHAAAAGHLETLISDPALLARLSPEAVFEALHAAHHADPIDPDSRSAAMHYFLERGAAPCSQGEWVALLHHHAVGSGDADTARALLATDVTLPWRTLWMYGHSPGAFDTSAPVRRPEVKKLSFMRTADADVVVCTDYERRQSAWSATTGQPVALGSSSPDAADVLPAVYRSNAGWPASGEHPQDGAQFPRLDGSVRRGLRVGELAVLSGEDGVFVLTVDPAEVARQPARVMKRMLPPVTRIGRRPLPPEARLPTTSWMEASLGPGTVHRIPESRLPAGLTNAAARTFLTTVGFPEVTEFLELQTPNVSETGLARDERSPEDYEFPVATGAAFYHLGEWQGACLLLDGTTGRVVQDGTSGIRDPLAASSLGQFSAMVRLYHWWFTSDWTVEDMESQLWQWLEEVDPDAFRSDGWQRVAEDHNFGDRV